ncbi:MAG: nitrate reductase molybdenum cofactor assembly chaperone [Burkholderiales bacterium]|nr:nitrate reductase molybdenum cofactor assembly chaperone [Burkholderiales bacterium]
MKTLKLLAVLLGYPSEGMVAALPEIARRLNAESALRGATQDALAGLLAELKREDLLDLQERYVAQFDAGRATSLHLFEHVHGDSRDRGQAMVDLNALYRRSGFVLAVSELPDYLPAVLEYLASRPAEEVHDLLEDCVHILRAVGERLLAGGSPYAAVFAALLDLHRAAPLAAPKGAAKAQLARPLDEEWSEAPVEFGAPPGIDAAAAHGAQQSRPQFIRFVPKNP